MSNQVEVSFAFRCSICDTVEIVTVETGFPITKAAVVPKGWYEADKLYCQKHKCHYLHQFIVDGKVVSEQRYVPGANGGLEIEKWKPVVTTEGPPSDLYDANPGGR